MLYYQTTLPSPLGPLTLVSDGQSLTGLWMSGQRNFPADQLADAAVKDGLPLFLQARDWLERYFCHQAPPPHQLPLAPAGTPFQQQVWQLLRHIPYGHTVTYGQLAHMLASRLGRPSMSAQAVGGAVGRNPIAILIPCHRVVGKGGSLTGYAGGLERKAALLALERISMSAP